jgi:hypothetical protein
MDAVEEIIELVTGCGLIEVRGNEFDSALFIDGKPIALNWSDCEGSVAQYMVRAGVTDCEDKLRSLRHVVEGNLRLDISISAQVLPFLELFANGHYRLRYFESPSDWQFAEFTTSWRATKDLDHFYPVAGTLVLTQPSDALRFDRVSHHLERIHAGRHPIALTATMEGGWCDFVIDGHHKLLAYKAAKVAPSFLSVCRLDAPRLSVNAFDECSGGRHAMREQYRRVKSQFDV